MTDRTPQRRYLIEATRYDPSEQHLHIQFRGGLTWTYAGVPQGVAAALRQADSLDKFYMLEIRDAYSRVMVPPSPRLRERLDTIVNT